MAKGEFANGKNYSLFPNIKSKYFQDFIECKMLQLFQRRIRDRHILAIRNAETKLLIDAKLYWIAKF